MANDSQLPALIGETSPELGAGDNLPAVFSALALPTDPSELESWEAKETGDFLESMVPGLRLLERADSVRLAVGMGLWKLRQTTVEGDYGRKLAALAESAGVGVSSLRRWRQAAEDHYELGPPPKATARSVAAKDRETRRSAQDVSTVRPAGSIEATAEEIPNTHLSGLEPDEPTGKTAPPVVAPDAPPAQPSAKDENEAVMSHVRGLLRSGPAVLSRAAKRSVLAELEGLLKRAQQANADDGSRVVLLAPDLVARLAVAPSEPFDAGVNRAIRDLLAPKPAGAPAIKKASGSKTRPAPARPPAPVDERAVQEAEYGTVNGKCIHPPSRVRNGLCFLCGAENIKAGR